jgi:hypothetical protein
MRLALSMNSPAPIAAQISLKIASTSAACASHPTVSASVRDRAFRGWSPTA